MTMLNIYDLTRKKTAVLQNAFNIIETHELNQIYSLSYTLPADDEKVQYCQPRHYVRWGDNGELYRIKSPKVSESDTSVITYECEHVITTLCDSIMFGSFQYGGASVHTRATITWLLSQQKTQNWVLDQCDFDRKFEYLWEQENILNALYSIPKEFASPYKWVFNTTVYPWKLSLKAINTSVNPEFYLRAKSNILSSGTDADYANICTRIYPLGYGEGVNQLNIKDVNNGVAYLQSPAAYTNKYGIVEKVLVDRRFENAESLKAYAQSMLDLYQEPSMSRSFDVTDLYQLTNQSWDQAEVGKICRMTQDNTTAYITKCRWQRDKAGDLQIDLSTKATDIASNVADLADRIRIESVYAQGATQLYQHSKDANATPSKGMVMSLYFPAEMRQINKVLLRLKLNRFRSYSQTTDAGGASTQTSSAGGASTRTSSEGGASTQTSSSGGGSTQTSSEGGESKRTSSEGGASTQTSSEGGESTQTSSAGGATGITSTSGGGTIDVSLTGTAAVTENANWNYYYYTHNNSSNLVVSSASPDGKTTSAGVHGHGLTISGSTATAEAYIAEVPGSAWHAHSLSPFATGTIDQNGGHQHDVWTNPHTHYFSVFALQHNHTVNIDVQSNVQGQTGFAHTHTFSIDSHTHTVSIPNHTHNVSIPNHTHTVSIPNHTHKITIPSHTHTVSIGNHTHTISIPNHTHSVSIPSHTHNISAGIFESGNATAFDIYVGNTKKTTVNATSYNGDITTWLLNNQTQMVPRDQWIDVTIVPNDLAYVVSSVFVQGFVQSRGGGNY